MRLCWKSAPPAAGSIFHLSPEFASEAQRIRLEAAGQPGLFSLRFGWTSAGCAPESAPYQIWWRLTPGEHRAWAEAIMPEGEKLTSPVVIFTVN